MCSLAVSTLDSPAVDQRISNPGSGKILTSDNLRPYATSPVLSHAIRQSALQ